MIDEAAINAIVNEKVKKSKVRPTFIELNRIRKQARTQLNSLGKDRFVKIAKKIFDVRYDVQVDVSTNRMDESIVIRQLQDLVFAASKMPDANIDVTAIIKEQLDLMGLSGTRFTKATPVQQPQPQQALNPGSPQGAAPLPTPVSESRRANVDGVVSPGPKG